VTETLLPTCRAERSEIGVGAGGRRVMGWPGAAHPATASTATRFTHRKAKNSDAGVVEIEARPD